MWRHNVDETDDNNPVDIDEGGYSIKKKMTILLTLAALSMSAIVVVISVKIYSDDTKKNLTESAYGAARLAASVLDPEMIDTYLIEGPTAEGYEHAYNHLSDILSNYSGVQYLYVMKIKEDGCYCVMDMETEDAEPYECGEYIPFEEAFMPYVPDLLEGKAIDPIESDDISGWVLTVYYPVYDKYGKCVCYVGADVSLMFFSDYVKDYLIRAVLIVSGFFILVLSTGLWLTNIYISSPIDSMTRCASNFVLKSSTSADLDENVRRIKALKIDTDDELEKLYRALCKMTSDTSEQIKEIRYYAKAMSEMQSGLINTMADMVENRDSDTGEHVQKTAAYVKIILNGLKKKGYYADKLTPKYVSDVIMSAPLHDVGKINIPDAILQKPGKLTPDEYDIMKTHAEAGRLIIEKAIGSTAGESYLKEARNMAGYHHEKWDGTGYPDKLKGDAIPLSARIMAVADVFDALTATRCYKKPMPLDKALSIITEGSGHHFDPKCVEVFMDSLPEVKQVLRRYQNSDLV